MSNNQNEQVVTDCINEMLKKPDFLFPFVAAQGQYRAHYYGLTAAALLEYFFIDMFSQYISIYDSSRKLSLPQHGKPGWDYEFDGIQISHKVGGKISDISGLWDATVKPKGGLYSSKTSIIYSIVNYTDKWGILKSNGQKIEIAAINQVNNTIITPNQKVLICRKNENDWTIREEISNTTNSDVEILDLISFRDVWKNNQSDLISNANAIEIFVVKNTKKNAKISNLAGQNVTIDFKFMPGLYLLDKEFLKNIKVKGNNRSSVLIPSKIVREAMSDAVSRNSFVYMSTWFSVFSNTRPPNLYLSQRENYSAMHNHSETRR